MQVKKEEVKNRIIEVAQELFLVTGFKGTSLRQIVKLAGTTLGNFYNYFDNKESLFEELVEKEYQQINYFMEHHEEIDELNDNQTNRLLQVTEMKNLKEIIMKEIVKMLPIFTINFVLLIEAGEGTKYKRFRQDFITFFENNYREHVNKSENINKEPYARILAEMFVNGLVRLIQNHRDEADLKELITKHFMFFMLGISEMIKNEEIEQGDEA